MTVIVAGGGIAGMTMALTCHQLELPVIVHESVKTIEPLGVGINLQPNAVRELFELGLERDLAEIGIQAKESGFSDRINTPLKHIAGVNGLFVRPFASSIES